MPTQFKTPLSPEAIRDSELYPILLKVKGQDEPLSEAVIADKLRAAEDFYEHALQIFFGERRVASDPLGRGLAVSEYDAEIPAFNFPTDFTWNYTELPYRPIRAITRAFFAFPGTPVVPMFTIPNDWIRLDRRFGKFQLVPTGAIGPIDASRISGYILSRLGGGRSVPQCVYVDYTAGITHQDLRRHNTDLLEAVRIRAALFVLGIASAIRTQGIGSQSLSQDGQSRSQSFQSGKFGPYGPTIEQWTLREAEIVAAWKSSERGIVMGVLGC